MPTKLICLKIWTSVPSLMSADLHLELIMIRLAEEQNDVESYHWIKQMRRKKMDRIEQVQDTELMFTQSKYHKFYCVK